MCPWRGVGSEHNFSSSTNVNDEQEVSEYFVPGKNRRGGEISLQPPKKSAACKLYA